MSTQLLLPMPMPRRERRPVVTVRRAAVAVRPVPAAAPRPSVVREEPPSLLRRVFGRRQANLFERCLAVHMASASNTSALR